MSKKMDHFFKLHLSVLVNGTHNNWQWMGTQQCGLPLLPVLSVTCCVQRFLGPVPSRLVGGGEGVI